MARGRGRGRGRGKLKHRTVERKGVSTDAYSMTFGPTKCSECETIINLQTQRATSIPKGQTFDSYLILEFYIKNV